MKQNKLDLMIYAQYGRYVSRGVVIRELGSDYGRYGRLTDVNYNYAKEDWLFEIDGEKIYTPAYLEGVSKDAT